MASRKVNEASELPIDVTIMGPLRPFSSDQVPRKQAVNMAGTVKAMFTKRMYREALFCTISSVLQKNLNLQYWEHPLKVFDIQREKVCYSTPLIMRCLH